MLNIEDQNQMDLLLIHIKTATFVCPLCKEIIFPSITINHIEDSVTITRESCNILGGKGNRILVRNICSDCSQKCY